MADSSPTPSRHAGARAIGLIGLGRMGSYYAERLLTAGYRLVVLDVDRDRALPVVQRGAREAANAFNLTSAVDAVLLALPDTPTVEAVMEGTEGVLSALAPGQLVIDLGTSLPSSTRRLAALVESRGGHMLDAPVTWRGERLTVMVGGARSAFDRAAPLLEAFAGRLGYVGPSGAGQLTKLVNQVVQAARTAALAEGLAFARSVGLDPAAAAELLQLDGATAMLDRRFEGHGELRLHTKDLGYALEVAQQSGLPMPLTATTNEIFKAVALGGDPSWRQTAVLTYWERLLDSPGDDAAPSAG